MKNLIFGRKTLFVSSKAITLISVYLSTAFLVNLYSSEQLSVYSIYILLPSFGSVILSAPLYSVCSREYSRYLASGRDITSYRAFSSYFARVYVCLFSALFVLSFLSFLVFALFGQYLPGSLLWLLGSCLLSFSQIFSSSSKALLNASGSRTFAVNTEACLFSAIYFFYWAFSPLLGIYPFLVFFIASFLHICIFFVRYLRIERNVRLLFLPSFVFVLAREGFSFNPLFFLFGRKNGYKWLSLSSLLPWLSQFFSRNVLLSTLGPSNLSLYFSLYTFLYTPFIHLSSVSLEYFSPRLHLSFFGDDRQGLLSLVAKWGLRMFLLYLSVVVVVLATYLVFAGNAMLDFLGSPAYLSGLIIFSAGLFSFAYRALQFISSVCGLNRIVVVIQFLWFAVYFAPFVASFAGLFELSIVSVSGFLLNANLFSSMILLIFFAIRYRKTLLVRSSA